MLHPSDEQAQMWAEIETAGPNWPHRIERGLTFIIGAIVGAIGLWAWVL